MPIKLMITIAIYKLAKSIKNNIKTLLPVKKQRSRVVREIVPLSTVIETLRKLGVAEGDCILLHSGISNVGKVEKGAMGLIKELKLLIGKDGCLLLPSFRFQGTMKNFLDNNKVVDLRKEKIKMGALPVRAASDHEFKESVHPTHTVLAYGSLGGALISEHHLSATPFDEYSPFYKLSKCNGKIVTIGVDLDKVTNFHVIEDMMGGEFPVKTYLSSIYEIDVKTADETFHVTTKSHNPDLAIVRKCMRFYNDFIDNDIMRIAPLGSSYVGVIDSHKMNMFLMERASQGSTIYGNF